METEKVKSKVSHNIYLDDAVASEVLRLALKESRSWNNMAGILLEKGLEWYVDNNKEGVPNA